jgi:hypothetical protein
MEVSDLRWRGIFDSTRIIVNNRYSFQYGAIIIPASAMGVNLTFMSIRVVHPQP